MKIFWNLGEEWVPKDQNCYWYTVNSEIVLIGAPIDTERTQFNDS